MSFVNNVRIVSDGTVIGTKVLTADGHELACKAIRFSQNADELPIVTIELIGVAVEIDMPRKTKDRQ